MSREELGQMSLRQYVAMWDALKLRERRQQGIQSVLVEQMGHMVAMVANTGFRMLWDRYRTAEEFMPPGWHERYGRDEAEEPEDFDTQLRRTMQRAAAYQAGQVARGIA